MRMDCCNFTYPIIKIPWKVVENRKYCELANKIISDIIKTRFSKDSRETTLPKALVIRIWVSHLQSNRQKLLSIQWRILKAAKLVEEWMPPSHTYSHLGTACTSVRYTRRRKSTLELHPASQRKLPGTSWCTLPGSAGTPDSKAASL